MRLLRGHAAEIAAAEILKRIAARGGDASRDFRDRSLIYTASASELDRHEIFQSAMSLLARTPTTSTTAQKAWLHATYLLYQAPRMKRGSDATIRTFLVAAGTQLLRRPPMLPHDLDLRAYVQQQGDFLTELETELA